MKRLRALILCFLLQISTECNAQAPQPIDLGPAWILLAPLYPIVKFGEMFPGADKKLTAESRRISEATIRNFTEELHVESIYFAPGAFALRDFHSFLSNSGIAFIEVNTKNLTGFAPAQIDDKLFSEETQRHEVVRYSLGKIGDKDCYRFRDSAITWNNPPFRPGICLCIQFSDVPTARYVFRLDLSLVERREVYWVLDDLVANRTVIKLPFWTSQIEGRPFVSDGITREMLSKFALDHAPKLLTESRPDLYISSDAKLSKQMAFSSEEPVVTVHSTIEDASSWAPGGDDLKSERASTSWADLYKYSRESLRPGVLDQKAIIYFPLQDKTADIPGGFDFAHRHLVIVDKGKLMRVRGWDWMDTGNIDVVAMSYSPPSKKLWQVRVVIDGYTKETMSINYVLDKVRSAYVTDMNVMVLKTGENHGFRFPIPSLE